MPERIGDESAAHIHTTQKIGELEIEVARLKAELDEARGSDSADGASRFLTMAAATVDQVITDANEEVATAVSRAEADIRQWQAEAEQEAEEMIAAARAQEQAAYEAAEQMREEARAEMEQTQATVQSMADEAAADAGEIRRHAESEAGEILSAAREEASMAMAEERQRLAQDADALADVRATLVEERHALDQYQSQIQDCVRDLAQAMVAFMTKSAGGEALDALTELTIPAIEPPPDAYLESKPTSATATAEPEASPQTDDSIVDADHSGWGYQVDDISDDEYATEAPEPDLAGADEADVVETESGAEGAWVGADEAYAVGAESGSEDHAVEAAQPDLAGPDEAYAVGAESGSEGAWVGAESGSEDHAVEAAEPDLAGADEAYAVGAESGPEGAWVGADEAYAVGAESGSEEYAVGAAQPDLAGADEAYAVGAESGPEREWAQPEVTESVASSSDSAESDPSDGEQGITRPEDFFSDSFGGFGGFGEDASVASTTQQSDVGSSLEPPRDDPWADDPSRERVTSGEFGYRTAPEAGSVRPVVEMIPPSPEPEPVAPEPQGASAEPPAASAEPPATSAGPEPVAEPEPEPKKRTRTLSLFGRANESVPLSSAPSVMEDPWRDVAADGTHIPGGAMFGTPPDSSTETDNPLFAPARPGEGTAADHSSLGRLFGEGSDRDQVESEATDEDEEPMSAAESRFRDFIEGDDDDASRIWLLRNDDT